LPQLEKNDPVGSYFLRHCVAGKSVYSAPMESYVVDEEVTSSMMGYVAQFYEDLRRAANNLAAVVLVTRMQHWISKFVKKIPDQPKPPKSDKTARLVGELLSLNKYLGEGSVPVTFFSDLINVRDSVIHGDSRAAWEFPANSLRRVPERYTNSWGMLNSR
jgi:hypothetical protein